MPCFILIKTGNGTNTDWHFTGNSLNWSCLLFYL